MYLVPAAPSGSTSKSGDSAGVKMYARMPIGADTAIQIPRIWFGLENKYCSVNNVPRDTNR